MRGGGDARAMGAGPCVAVLSSQRRNAVASQRTAGGGARVRVAGAGAHVEQQMAAMRARALRPRSPL